MKRFQLPLFLFMCQLSFVVLLFPLGPCVLTQCGYELQSEGTSEVTATLEHCIQIRVEYVFMLGGFILHLLCVH